MIRFLVRYRGTLLLVMALLAVGSLLLIPRIKINSDLSKYLPESSRMKQGMDRLAEDFPQLDTRMRTLDVMFTTPIDADAVGSRLDELTGGMLRLSLRESPPYTLFQYRISGDGDPGLLLKEIKKEFGDEVTVEISGDDKMPANLGFILLLGVSLAFLILVVMCASWMEVPLFLITVGIAVIINMGTNAFLESVSMMTNSMVAVLQMVLSMDYSIIVMNRYKQERQLHENKTGAMEAALKGAAPSVLSSAFTTVVSLLMLMFMRFKIGADLGIVLSKGVLLSLICNFTVLPALILRFDKAIEKSRKRVPVLPSSALSSFEMRFRIPLALLFVALFVGSFLLQKRTTISFSAIWPTEISEKFPPRNNVIMLYETRDERDVIPVLDTITSDPMVGSAISYPGLALKGYTAHEMAQMAAGFSPLVSEDLLDIVYYAQSRPERTERFSLIELQELAESLPKKGLVPGGIDMNSLMAQFDLPEEKTVKGSEPQAEPEQQPQLEPEQETETAQPVEQAETIADSTSTAVAVTAQDTAAVPAQEAIRTGRYTYEQATTPLTARQMADSIGISRTYVNTIFRISGHSGKDARMSPHEFVRFVSSKVLTDKRYAAFISKSQAEDVHRIMQQLDSAVAAGPPKVFVPAVDSTLIAAAQPESEELSEPEQEAPVEEVAETEPEEEPEPEPTPMERLAEMALSGQRYNSRQVATALRAAGIPVSRDDMDLLYLYAGSLQGRDSTQRMSIVGMIGFLADTMLANPKLSGLVGDDASASLAQARQMLDDNIGQLRSERSSMAAIVSDYEVESQRTFNFIDRVDGLAAENLSGEHYLIGESVMFKELKESFPSELLLLTILTILSIFVIVAATFRSLIIPVPLILTVLSGVYFNVFASGLGGNTMFFMAYLIVQSILMGAIIDYSILMTNYYLDSRRSGNGRREAIADAYKGSGHSIMTSGLIIVLTPMLMYLTIDDPMIAMILKSLSIGALAAILIILLVLPAVLALLDRLIVKKGSRSVHIP